MHSELFQAGYLSLCMQGDTVYGCVSLWKQTSLCARGFACGCWNRLHAVCVSTWVSVRQCVWAGPWRTERRSTVGCGWCSPASATWWGEQLWTASGSSGSEACPVRHRWDIASINLINHGWPQHCYSLTCDFSRWPILNMQNNFSQKHLRPRFEYLITKPKLSVVTPITKGKYKSDVQNWINLKFISAFCKS